MKKTKLILGAAGVNHPDAITLDIEPGHNPDVVHDLQQIPWPFEDNQFTEIICHHVLEHLDDIGTPLKELYRICSSSGQIYIEVPHFSSLYAHTPHHKLHFGYFSLDGYIEGGTTQWVKSVKFKLLEKKITFHRAFRRHYLHKLFNRFPLSYERFWTYICPAENLIFRLQPVK